MLKGFLKNSKEFCENAKNSGGLYRIQKHIHIKYGN